MPTYTYKCDNCKIEWEEAHTINERKVPTLVPCSHCENGKIEHIITSAPRMCDSVRMGFRKPDNGFKEVLQKIHSKAPGSQLDKTSQIVKL